MNKETLRKKILDKIHQGEVTMKPKMHFVLKTIASITGIILVFGFSMYLTSLIYFMLRVKGYLMLPGLGIRGISAFLVSLPWILILLIIVLIVALELLSKHFRFVYRKPLLYSTLGIVLILIAGSFMIIQGKIHDRVYTLTQERGVPLAASLYQHTGMMNFRQSHVGTVIAIDEQSITLLTPDGRELTVELTSMIHMPPDSVELNDQIMVAGTEKNGCIQAFGIRPIPKNDFFLHIMPHRGYPKNAPLLPMK